MTKKISLEGARVLAGLSQKEAAEKFGVNVATLQNWEKNPQIMKRMYTDMIPDIYYVSDDAIFFGTKNEFTRYYREM